MLKVGDLVILNESFREHLKGCEQEVLAAWLVPKYFIIEDICKAAKWCYGVEPNQLSINAYVGRDSMPYVSIRESDLSLYCKPYMKLDYETVEDSGA